MKLESMVLLLGVLLSFNVAAQFTGPGTTASPVR